MFLQDRLQQIKSKLVAVTNNCYHYKANKPKTPYIVWAEDGAESILASDNSISETALHGTIDIYSKTEFDPIFDAVPNTLNQSDKIICTLKSVQFEDETNTIHYEYDFEVL